MSVLIKGMEMPEESVKSITIFPDGNVRIWGSDIDHDEWAEAIEVSTPHGDLIDRNKASKRFAELSENIEAKLGYEYSASYTLASLFLQNKGEFLTIIEKEEKK